MLVPKKALKNSKISWGTEILTYPSSVEAIISGEFVLKSGRVDVVTQTIFDTWKLYVENGYLKFSRNNGETIDTVAQVDSRRIYHIVIALDKTSVAIYIDGVKAFSKTYTTTLNYDFYLDALSFEGDIALLRIYTFKLMEEEAKFNYDYYRITYVREPLVYCDYDTIDIENGVWKDKKEYRNGDIQQGTIKQLIKTIT